MLKIPNKFVSGADFSSLGAERCGVQVSPHDEKDILGVSEACRMGTGVIVDSDNLGGRVGCFEEKLGGSEGDFTEGAQGQVGELLMAGEGNKMVNSVGCLKKLSNLIRSSLFTVLTGTAVLGAVPGCVTAYDARARIAGRNSAMGEYIFHNFNFSNYPRFSEDDLKIAAERSFEDLVVDREHCSEMHPDRFCSVSKEGDSLRHQPDLPQVYYTVGGASFEVKSAGSLVVFLENVKNRNLIKNFFEYEFARIEGVESRFKYFGRWKDGFGEEPIDIKKKSSAGEIDGKENAKEKLLYFEKTEFKERLARARSIMNFKDLRGTNQLLKIYKLIGRDPELYGLFTRFAVQYDWDPGSEAIHQYRHPVYTLRTGRGDCDDYSMGHYFWAYMQGYKPYLVYIRIEGENAKSSRRVSGGHVFVWYYDENGDRIVMDNRWVYRYKSTVPITEIVNANLEGNWKIVENLHHPVERGRR